jgi:hypothetical protein
MNLVLIDYYRKGKEKENEIYNGCFKRDGK